MIHSWKSNHILGGGEAIAPLAAEHPVYNLPRVIKCHKRHYVPTKSGSRQLIDAFVTIGDGRVIVMWPGAELNIGQRSTIQHILEGIRYLGRAESRVTLRACQPKEPNCVPYTGGNHTLVDVMTVAPGAALTGPGTSTISVSVRNLRADKRVMPPAAQTSQYILDAPRAMHRPTTHNATVVRFALDGNLLRRGMAVTVGRAAKSAILARLRPVRSATLSGHGSDGEPLRSPHIHAHYIPTAEDGGRIDHLTVFAPCGLNSMEQDAVRGLSGVWCGGSFMRAVYQGEGYPQDFSSIAMFSASRSWVSVTPYVPPRYVWRAAGGAPRTAAVQVARELTDRYGACAESVTVIRGDKEPFNTNAGHGVSGGAPEWLRLEMDDVIHGPLVLGYGSHIGLGLFIPEDTHG